MKSGCLDKLNETQIQKIAISLLKYCKDNLHVLDVRGAKEKERKIQFDPMSAVFLMLDELRDFGFSKDSKTGDVQVLLGLLVDGEGRPIGFDIFPGNTFEGHTLKGALNKLSGRFSIRRLILIADCAMLSSNNLDCIKECGYEYIVGGRIKSKSQKIKEEILDKDGYVSLVVDGEEEQFMYKNIKIGNLFIFF